MLCSFHTYLLTLSKVIRRKSSATSFAEPNAYHDMFPLVLERPVSTKPIENDSRQYMKQMKHIQFSLREGIMQQVKHTGHFADEASLIEFTQKVRGRLKPTP